MKLIIVSNRLPVTIKKEKTELKFKQSVGGLVSGISDYLSMLNSSSFFKSQYIWIGSLGADVGTGQSEKFTEKFLDQYHCHPVFIQEDRMNKFYHGLCNKTLWPLFHSFPQYVEYDEEDWQIYYDVNLTFAQQILEVLESDDIVLINDYHLMLLPQMIRTKVLEAKIIFFLHIPFPNFEIFSLLPKKWRIAVLKGLIGADVIGFHTYEYSQNFLQCILRFMRYEHKMGKISAEDGRVVKIGTYPIGINFQKFYEAVANPQIADNIKALREKLEGYKVLLSIDRLDYTKGLTNRLKGYETFLKGNPQYLGKIVLIMIIVPSRVGVEQYQETKRQIDEMVGRINGKFGNISWTPILYEARFIPFEDLSPLYSVADVALVTPLRDGMNLIAKEYVASRVDQTGVLILSEMAGAAKELTDAILVNPNDISEVALSIREALEMPVDEQIRRNKIMQDRIKRYDIVKWGNDMIEELSSIKEESKKFSVKLLTRHALNGLMNKYKNAEKRIILLDYDGTLVPFATYPFLSRPDIGLLKLIEGLAGSKKNEVAILSGRDRNTLIGWFGSLNISLVAEHGVWIKKKTGTDWEMMKNLRNDWETSLIPILKDYSDRLPGSFIEEKDFSLALHYRQSDPEQSSMIINEAFEYLISFTANFDVQVMQGNKVIEIRCSGVNKGTAALLWLSKHTYDFILAIGDDLTDEDLFKVIPQQAFTIKVGLTKSNSKFNVPSYVEVRELLKQLTET